MKYVWIVGNGVAVIGAIVCMSYLYRFRWSGSQSRWPLLSVAIIGITALVTSFQFVYPEILSGLRRNPSALAAGEWWRLITPLFVQPQGWVQCAVNAFFLIAFVPLAERIYSTKLLVLYFVPGIVGQIVNYFWSPTGGGASAAAFGVMGGLLVYIIRHRAVVARPCLMIAISGLCAACVLSFTRDGHGPSLLAGAVVAALIQGRDLPELKRTPNKPMHATCEDARA